MDSCTHMFWASAKKDFLLAGQSKMEGQANTYDNASTDCLTHTRERYQVDLVNLHRGPLRCLVMFAAVWLWGAISPLYRDLWFYENLLVLAMLIVLLATYRRFRFSTLSYALITSFFVLHLIGAHFGYNEVPPFDRYEQWGWSRNPYDRIVHFSFGLLVVWPFRESLLRLAGTGPGWSSVLSLALVMACSVLYELFEWAFVLVAHPGMGPMFLGAQGDPWDSHADMALAALGGVLTLIGASRFVRSA